MDSIELNREIAYKGRIGCQREKFCIDYISRKKKIFNVLLQKQNETVLSKSETITCAKGCFHCCVLFVGASIQEGEAIVYYLYQNKDVLDRFIKKYPLWRAKVREADKLIKRQLDNKNNSDGVKLFQEKVKSDKLGDLARYARQRIYCPFLDDGICTIYEIRPFLCAGLIVTTPSDWCNPLHPNNSRKRTYQTYNPYSYYDTSFYYQEIKEPVWSFMPIMVYNLLKNGISGIPQISGLEKLRYYYLNDPEVQSIIKRFKLSKSQS